jgi:hypothetical protein
VLRRFPDAGISLTEILRAQNQRYWSYLCTNPECCPPEGTPFDPKAHPVAAKLGGRAVLASRAALARTVAPVTGDEAKAMNRATSRAEAGARRLIRQAGITARRKARRQALHAPGLLAVAEAIARYREGRTFDSRTAAAWLALVLEDLPARDDAWARMDPEHNEAHVRLWTDVTRLARPGYAAAYPQRCWPSPPGRAATGPSRTSPSTERSPTSPTTRWPGCSARRSTAGRRRPWPASR